VTYHAKTFHTLARNTYRLPLTEVMTKPWTMETH